MVLVDEDELRVRDDVMHRCRLLALRFLLGKALFHVRDDLLQRFGPAR